MAARLAGRDYVLTQTVAESETANVAVLFAITIDAGSMDQLQKVCTVQWPCMAR